VRATSGTFLYLGGPDGPSSSPIELPSRGTVIACAGDVDGDGLADIVLGPGVSIVFGDASGVFSTPTTLAEPSGNTGDGFGNSVAAAGDIDGDGFADLLVGAPSEDGSTGRAYVYLGSASGPAAAPIEIDGASDFGSSVAGAGDVNGDGFADVLVGVPPPDASATSPQGTVSLYWGDATGPGSTPVVLGAFYGYTFASLDLVAVHAAGTRGWL
jgi:hypothetical protein